VPRKKQAATAAKFKLFPGPKLALWMKWRCPQCKGHRAGPVSTRKVWEEPCSVCTTLKN